MSERLEFRVCVKCMTYNHERFITDALYGFVAQNTTFPVVYTIVDDASTDGNVSEIKKFLDANFDLKEAGVAYEKDTDYGHISFARHKNNKNCFFAIVCLKENHHRQKKKKAPYIQEWMNTEFIAICEGDDYWKDSLKLQKQVDFLESHQEYGLCYTDFDLYDQNSKQFTKSVFENGVYHRPSSFEEHLVGCGYIAPMSWVYRKRVFDGLEYQSFTDGTFAQALAFYRQSKVYYMPIVTCVYRAHSGSASRPVTAKRFFRQYKGVFDTQLYFAEKYQVEEKLVCLIKSGAFIKLLPSAIESKNEQFVEEAISYFESQGIDYNELLKLCNSYIQAKKDIRDARKSQAYRIGRTILKPVNLLKRLKK